MDATQKIASACFIALVWLASIVLKHVFPDLDTAQFNSACFAALVGLGAFHAGQSSTTPDAAPTAPSTPLPTVTQSPGPSPIAGRINIGMMLALAAVALLAACTTTTASIYRGYAADAKAGIQTWDDNAIATVHDLFCAQPYSAIQRHPEIQPGIIALCGGMANVTALDPNQVQLMLSIAKQLGYPVPTQQGVQPAATPAK